MQDRGMLSALLYRIQNLILFHLWKEVLMPKLKIFKQELGAYKSVDVSLHSL